MQPVHKKNTKPNRRRLILILILCLIMILAALLFWFYFKGKHAQSALPEVKAAEDQQITLIGKAPEDLMAFEVFPPGHASYRLVREGDFFQVADSPEFSLNAYMIEQMAEDLTSLSAEKIGLIEEVTGGAEALGLVGEHFRVIAEYSDHSSLTLSFGNAAYTEIPTDYFMLSGDSSVYLVSPQIRSNLDFPLGALSPLPRIDFSSDLLTSLQVTEEEAPFTLELTGGFWQLTSPLKHPADLGAVATLINDIGDMRLAVYVGEAEELSLSDYGLARPAREVAFHLAESLITTYAEDGQLMDSQEVAAQSLRFAVGDDIDRVGFYCLYQGAVYQASYASMGFITTLQLTDLLAKKPVVIPINQLLALAVEEAGEKRLYQVELTERIEQNNEIALDEQGQPLYDPWIMLDGVEIDSEAFVLEYLKLMDLSGQGRLPEGFSPSGSPLKRFSFSAEGMALELAFYPYDALHAAMAVNGQAFWYVNTQSVEDIAL